jgi:hypothetical protein
MKMEIGTAKISKEQAENVLAYVKSNKGFYADVPETNGCVTLHNGVTLRKLPVKFRGGDPRSKAFRLKGEISAMRTVMRYVNMDTKKSVSMTISKES